VVGRIPKQFQVPLVIPNVIDLGCFRYDTSLLTFNAERMPCKVCAPVTLPPAVVKLTVRRAFLVIPLLVHLPHCPRCFGVLLCMSLAVPVLGQNEAPGVLAFVHKP
jgi:hypothetical protein